MGSKDFDLDPFLRRNNRFVQVVLTEVEGSAPREERAWMLVGKTEIFRTIGGGQLELQVIEKARKLLLRGRGGREELWFTLGPETGQCCGGRVRVEIKVPNQKEREQLRENTAREFDALPRVYVFGAGHVGKALLATLALLPVRPVAVDTRQGELESLPETVERHLVAMPETVVREARPNSAFVILTHDHGLDFLVTSEALQRRDAVYVGMIGSKTKRATFSSWLRREGLDTGMCERLVCPIGSENIPDKRPEVIAALVAAEIVKSINSSARADDISIPAELAEAGFAGAGS